MNDVMKVSELSNDLLLKFILEEVAFCWGVIQMVDEKKGKTWIEVCGYDGNRKENETEQAYEDRIYTDAHDAVMCAVERCEESEYLDFEGCDLDSKDGVAWYDEVREEAIGIVCGWFRNGQKEISEEE